MLLMLLTISNQHAVADSLNTLSGRVELMTKNGKPLADHSNVVVFVDGLELPSTPDSVSMSHKGKQFSPRVLPIVSGTSVDFFNDDDVFHNVFSVSPTKPFDLGIYAQGATKKVRFKNPGLVRVYCNIHPNMISNVLVLNNALFAMTDTEGRYRIEDVPDGEFTLRAWYEFGEPAMKEVSISGGKVYETSFEIVATKRIKKHKNKFGKPYRQKY